MRIAIGAREPFARALHREPELVQKSGTDAFKIIQDRMQESYEEIRGSLEKK